MPRSCCNCLRADRKIALDISVVIVHYRTEELLSVCLQHLYKSLNHSGLTNETFVVDNDSMLRKIQPIQSAFAQAHWIKNKKNEGFSKATNQGLDLAQGKYCLLLNPDCVVSRDTVGHLVRAMEADLG